MNRSFSKRAAYLAIGGVALFVAAGYLGLTMRLPFGRLDQPGAAMFPVGVGLLVALTSLMVIVEGWRMPREEQVDIPDRPGLARIAGLLGALLGYLLLLPWLGQFIAGALFCAALLRLLSNTAWPRVVAFSCLLSLSLYVVFVKLLQVPMPRGMLYF